jgi:hypothetical protein
VSWQDPDNGAADVADYVISVDINGENFVLTHSLPECDVTFAAGIFTLDCGGPPLDLELGPDTCAGDPDTLTVLSIEDPQANVLSPTEASCQLPPQAT